MKKKLLASLLIVVAFVCVFAFGASAAVTEISTATQLKELMDETGIYSTTGEYKLTADIDMSSVTDQTPIGTSGKKFSGIFDGDGHTISGLNISTSTDTTYPYIGLFGLCQKATIKNLTVDGTISGTQYVAGLVAWARGITIENCHNYCDVTASSSGAAGLLGYVDFNGTAISAIITDCTNHGTVQGTEYSGGILGLTQSVAKANQTLKITGCKNYGNVTITTGNCVGGIVGYYRCGDTTGGSSFTVSDAENYGIINNKATASSKGGYTGGIVGAVLASGSNGKNYSSITLTNLYNKGEVKRAISASIGSIVGYLTLPVVTDGTVDVTISDWVNDSTAPAWMIYSMGNAGVPVALEMTNIVNNTSTKVFSEEKDLSAAITINTNNTVTVNNYILSDSTAAEKEAFIAAAGDVDYYIDNGNVALLDTLELDETIGSPEELVLLMNDSSAWGGDYKLACDIDLTGYEQTPIGTSAIKFSGTFDGQGHTISGVNISSTAQGAGLFGMVQGSGTTPAVIENLNVKGSVTSTSSRAGGLIGVVRSPVTIQNCNVDMTVSATSGAAGGIVGTFGCYDSDTILIENCTFSGSVSGSQYLGGIMGYVLLGSATPETLIIRNCTNNATVTGTTGSACAGILGMVSVGKNSTVTVENCTNNGDISGRQYNGGIVGYIYNASTTTVEGTDYTITGCKNYGKVESTTGNVAGGILGFYANVAAVTSADVCNTLTLTKSANYGDVSVSSDTGTYAGGVAGAIGGGTNFTASVNVTLSELYNAGTASVHQYEGSVIGLIRPLKNGSYTISDLHGGDKSTAGVIGAFGSSKEASPTTFTITRAYNAGGANVVDTINATSYNTFEAVNCITNTATAAELLTYAETYTDTWVMTFDGPMLKEFAKAEDIITFPYTITTADQLIRVMNSPRIWDGDFVLGDNINLTGVENQAPIGNTDMPFTGTFDGGEYTVSGLNISGNGVVGFFGAVENAVISDLTVAGTVTSERLLDAEGNSLHDGAGAAGLVAYANGITLTNCVNNVDVTGTYRVAGIIGSLDVENGYTTRIENVINNGTITSSCAMAAGIAGRIYGIGEGNATFTDCVNNGNVTAGHQAGGFVGRFDITRYGGNSTYTIERIANYGNIESTLEGADEIFAAQSNVVDDYAGGIAGVFTSGGEGYTTENLSVTFDSLYNEGSIKVSERYVGGIFGYFRCYDDYQVTVSNVMNAGSVYAGNTDESSGGAAGGIFGAANHGGKIYTATNMYNSGSVTSATGTGISPLAVAWGSSYDVEGAITNGYYLDIGETYTATHGGTKVTTENYTDAATFAGIGTSDKWLMTTTGPELVFAHEHTYNTNGVCTSCGHTTCEHPIDEVADAIWVERTEATGDVVYDYVCQTCQLPIIEGAEKPYIYVDNNGSGNDLNNGVTTETAVKTIHAAITKMAKTGGDVILTSRYRTGTINDLPKYEKEITFTSLTDENDQLTTGFVFTAHGMTFNLNGPTKFEKIIFNGSNASAQNNSDSGYYNIPVFAANWNDLTMGERILCFGVAYIAVGSNGVSASEVDLEGKTVNITLHRTVARAITDTDGNVLTAARAFYDRVYLGDRVRTDAAYTVKNVNINFTSEDATFNNVYLGTVSNAASNAQMVNYNVVANFNGISDPYITTLRTGDGNATTGDAYLESLELNLNGYAYVKTDFVIRNIKNLKLNISTGAERTSATLNKVPFYISASDAFKALGLETTTEVSYGTHSFANGVEYPMFNEAYGEVVPTVTDECTYETTVTEHTADAMGVKTTACTVCERVTETVEFHVESYNEIKWAYDETAGAYVFACPVCGEVFGSAETATVYVSDDGDDANTGVSADSAVKTLTAAVTRLADVDGTVMINGTYTLDEDEVLPAWSGKILFTADPETHDGNGAAKSGFVIAKTNVSLSMGGDAKFDGILFKGASSSVFRVILSANWNDIEMGYIRVQNYAKMYLLAGVYYQKTDDTEEKTSTMTVDGPGMSTNSGDYFYERIYLGSIYLADGIEVSNKTVTATFRDGYINTEDTTRDQALTINTLYMMSTAGNNNFKASTTNGCVSTAYINDNTGILNIRTGDRNVNQTASEGKVDNVYFYFNDNSNVVDIGSTQGTFYVRNAVNTYVYISDMDETQAWEGEGVRTEKFAHSVAFQKYGTFKDKYAAATVTYGTHSFVDSITDPVQNPGEYVVTKVVNDECEGNWDDGVITTEPTAEKDGVMTYTCTVCGKTYTEEVAFECTSHVYLKTEDGSYICGICGEPLDAPTGSAVISAVAGTVKDGAVSVDIVVTADAIAGTYFTVTAPDSFTLASVSNAMNEANGFQLVSPDALTNPCKFMLVNFSGSDGALREQVVVTLNYTVADTFSGTGEIAIECHQTVNAAEAELETVTVNAVIAHEHDYVKGDLIPDTADKAAHYVYTCACGDAYEEEAAAETIAADSIKYGSSAILSSDIAPEYLVQLSNTVAADRVWLKVEFYAYGAAEPEVTVAEAYKTTVGTDVTTYRFLAPGIAAKEMGDRIVVTFCAEIDGVKYEADASERNFVTYYNLAYAAYGNDNRGQIPLLMELLYAMLNYGAEAQSYFGYNTEALVNTNIPAEKQKTEFVADATATQSSTDDCADDVYAIDSFYAVLEQKIILSLKFKAVGTAYSADSLVFKGGYTDVLGREQTIEISGDNFIVGSNGTVTVDIDTVSPKDLRQMITGALYLADGTQISDSITFSFECYATQAYATDDAELKDICAAILCYADAAEDFYTYGLVTE